MAIAVLVNPRSRANRRTPGLADRFAGILGDTGRVVAPASLAELDRVAAALRDEGPEVIAVHGGDGTLHRTLSALLRAFDGRPLPPLAPLCGGTMNVVASSLGIAVRPELFLEDLREAARAGRRLDTLRRRCLRIGDRYGFIFGNGLAANFLGEYYGPGEYGPGRAVWMLVRTFFSALVGGGYARRIFRRWQGRLVVDGAQVPGERFTAVSIATVREVGMGFKLNHRADEDPERMAVLAIHAGPLALALDVKAVHEGRGIAARRAWSALAVSVDVEPTEGPMAYTVDGDMYEARGPLAIRMGPPVDFVRPAGR